MLGKTLHFFRRNNGLYETLTKLPTTEWPLFLTLLGGAQGGEFYEKVCPENPTNVLT